MIRSKRPGGVLIASLAAGLVLPVSGWVAYSRIASEFRAEYKKSLDTVLKTSHEAVQKWSANRRRNALAWARYPKVRELSRELLRLQPAPDSLLGSPIQEALRQEFRHLLRLEKLVGFSVINTENIRCAAMRDEDVGTLSPLASQQTWFLDRVWAGETVVSPPMVPTQPHCGLRGIEHPVVATIYVGAPIVDDSGTAIAALVFRVDPTAEYTSIFERGRIGETGETYAFNDNAVLVSRSRFEDQLRQSKLIAAGKRSILNIRLHDPDTGEPTLMAKSAISGRADANMDGYNDYRGIPVVGTWLWDRDLRLGITTEIDIAQAYGSLTLFRGVMLGFSGVSALLLLLLTVVFVAANKKLATSEERLRRERRTLMQAEAAAHIGHWTWSTATGNITWSEECFRIFGRDPQTWVPAGDNFRQDMPAEDRQLLKAANQRGFETGRPFETQYRYYRGGAREDVRWIFVSCDFIKDERGEIVEMVGIAQDITERKRLEKRLADAVKHRAVAQVTGGVAHHFNNLLTVVMGNLGLLRRTVEDDPDSADAIDRALAASRTGADITRHLMAYSQHQLVQPSLQDIDTVVAGYAAELRGTLATGIRLQTSLAATSAGVAIDNACFQAALGHLVENAAAAMPEGGTVRISTDVLEVAATAGTEQSGLAEGEYVRIAVQDTGYGMSPEAVERAAEPFFTTSDVGKKKGLGLSLVSGFARQAGGELTIRSRVGEGTTAALVLPKMHPKPSAEGC